MVDWLFDLCDDLYYRKEESLESRLNLILFKGILFVFFLFGDLNFYSPCNVIDYDIIFRVRSFLNSSSLALLVRKSGRCENSVRSYVL